MIELIEIEEQEQEEQNGFTIADDITADWALEKINEERKERDRLISLCNRQIDVLKQRICDLNTRCDNKTAYLETALYNYFMMCERRETKTTESYQLNAGKLVYKKPKTIMVKDDAKLIEWCKNNGNWVGFVKTEEKLMWNELKKSCTISGDMVVTADGEIVEGITVEEEAGKFEIKGE